MPNHPDVHASTRLDDAVAYRIYRTNRLLLTRLARVLAEAGHGLSPEKWLLLAAVNQAGSVRQVDLTEPALGDAPNVSRLVEAMVREGLLERDLDPSDRRVRVLRLTPDGERVTSEMMAVAVEERRRVFAGLTDAELQVLTATLDHIDDNVTSLLLGQADQR